MKRLALLLTVVASGCGSDSKKTETMPIAQPEPEPVVEEAEEPVVEEPFDPGDYKVVTPDQLGYKLLDPENDKGPEIAVVHGNPMEGASAFFLKVPAKGKAGVHTHTASYRALVVSGSPKHWLPGERRVKPLSSGSFWLQPGDQAHGDSCDGPEPCVFFIISEGKWDFAPSKVRRIKKSARGDYKLVRSDDLKFSPLNPDQPDGSAIAFADGDPKTGPVSLFIDGKGAPLHSHTSDYHAVVLSGEPSHWVDGGPGEKDALAVGSFWFQPGGQVHGDGCLGEQSCRLFIFMPEAADFIPKP